MSNSERKTAEEVVNEIQQTIKFAIKDIDEGNISKARFGLDISDKFIDWWKETADE